MRRNPAGTYLNQCVKMEGQGGQCLCWEKQKAKDIPLTISDLNEVEDITVLNFITTCPYHILQDHSVKFPCVSL